MALERGEPTFQKAAAMALHYQSVVKMFMSDASSRECLRLEPNDALEFHKCLVSCTVLPAHLLDAWDAADWWRFCQHCHHRQRSRRTIFNEWHLANHKAKVLNYPYRRDAYKARYGSMPKTLETEFMDQLSMVFMASEDDDAWRLSDERLGRGQGVPELGETAAGGI